LLEFFSIAVLSLLLSLILPFEISKKVKLKALMVTAKNSLRRKKKSKYVGNFSSVFFFSIGVAYLLKP